MGKTERPIKNTTGNDADNAEEALEVGPKTNGDKPSSAPKIEAENLRLLAGAYVDQADNLRKSARNYIRWIVATVSLMTVLIVVLPPIIDVVEDEILRVLGRETSKFDFQTETRNQAIEVQANSTLLLQMLRDRKDAVDVIQSELAKPYHFFRPELFDEKTPNGEVFVLDMIQNDNLIVAVGGKRELNDFTPVIFVKTAETENLRLVENLYSRLEGVFSKAALFDDGVLVAGAVSRGIDVWYVMPNGTTKQQFTLPGSVEEISQISASDSHIAFLISLGNNGWDVLVTDRSGKEIWRRTYGMGQVAKDLVWSGQDLLILASGGIENSEGIEIHRASGFSEAQPSVGISLQSASIPDARGGISFVRDESTPDSVSILAIDVGFVERFAQQSKDDWFKQREHDFEIDSARYQSDIGYAAVAKERQFFSGVSNTLWVKPDTTAEAVSIKLQSKLGLDSAFQIRLLNDNRLRLMPLLLRDEKSRDSWSVYTEAPSPQLPDVTISQDITELLEGIRAGENSASQSGSGDQTAASKDVIDGENYLINWFAELNTDVRTEWIMSAEVFVQLETLEKLARNWADRWKERERAATILARLRQADETGSLFNEVSSLGARLAVIALLIYLVNILVNLYRYNMRLAAFYQAQGNTIELVLAAGADARGMVGQSFKDLAGAHTPETVSFGARPAPPTETVLKSLADLAKLIKP